jgi:Protein of unknown function (DUF1800)
MGMPLYGAQPPTGYLTKADAWVNSSSLLARMNFALTLTGGKLKGVQTKSDGPSGSDTQVSLARIENTLLGGDVSRQTHETIAAKLGDPVTTQGSLDDSVRVPNVALITGLLLGSPEFQRR